MAETATTATCTIMPTTADVVGGAGVAAGSTFGWGSTGSGKTLREHNLATRLQQMPHAGYNYVKEGGTYALVSGRTFRYDSAWANIAGYLVRTKDTGETLTSEASTTCYTWLQLVRNSSLQVTGARWVVTNSTAVPALPTNGITGDQVLFGYTTANASAITAQSSTPRGIILPGKVIARSANNGGAVSGASGTIVNTLDYVHDPHWVIQLRVRGLVSNNTAGANSDYGITVDGTTWMDNTTTSPAAGYLWLVDSKGNQATNTTGPHTVRSRLNMTAGTMTAYANSCFLEVIAA